MLILERLARLALPRPSHFLKERYILSQSRLYTNTRAAQERMDCPEPIVVKATAPHTATVIWMHGLGDTGAGWADVAPMFSMPWTKFVFPTAPTRNVKINFGMPGTAWFDLMFGPSGIEEEVSHIDDCNKYVKQLIQKEIDAGIKPNRIALGGFSQGGGLALFCGLNYDKPLAGVVALSTWLIARERYPGNIHAENMNVPILQCHGDSDDLVKTEFGKMTNMALKNFGVSNIDFKLYPGMGHSSCPEEITEIKSFLGKILPQNYDENATTRTMPKSPNLAPSKENINDMSVKELKLFLTKQGADITGCVEKNDLINLAKSYL